MEFLNQGFDHVEYSVKQISTVEPIFKRMGFEKVGSRNSQAHGTQTVAYAQGRVRILITQPASSQVPVGKSPTVDFHRKQDEGICVLGVEVRDATRAFQDAVKRGAKPALEPTVSKSSDGVVVRSEIWTPGQVRYAFMERHQEKKSTESCLFDEDLTFSRLDSPTPFQIHKIDHLTNNVGMGKMKDWVEYYKEVFDFEVTRHFDIRTGRTGLISDVVQSKDRKITVPINEATEKESQVQEFVDRMKGPGVQHLAFLSSDIQLTLNALRKSDFKFLTVPHTYYEVVPTRVPGVIEDLGELEKLGILLDGEGGGYLLQVFSEEVLGPFFFEFIQRRGNNGFGEGNFRALFEAIERDQIRRGVLKG
ncbi:MAG: 4-hydroxyphenylpyruvate dioxygenase [Bdellovibrio sp.]|nr:4-hydroxyphenylpyruvate dioxygenase [Bdellovibrio sp.]